MHFVILYDKPDSQYSQLVMAVRKVETETPGSGVTEARAKSAMVDVDSKSKAASSDTPYVAITQQITYLMSTVTNQNINQNKSNNGQNSAK